MRASQTPSRATVAIINARFMLTSPFTVAGGGRASLLTAPCAWNGCSIAGSQGAIHMPDGHFSAGELLTAVCISSEPARECSS
jgi:hypothetical protein